jgi:hypothetical protein
MENNYYIKIDCLKFESCFFVKNNNKTLNYKHYNNIKKGDIMQLFWNLDLKTKYYKHNIAIFRNKP